MSWRHMFALGGTAFCLALLATESWRAAPPEHDAGHGGRAGDGRAGHGEGHAARGAPRAHGGPLAAIVLARYAPAVPPRHRHMTPHPWALPPPSVQTPAAACWPPADATAAAATTPADAAAAPVCGTGSDGHLVLTRGLRDLFDAQLADGDDDAAVAAAQAAVAATCEPAAQGEALALLGRYVTWRRASVAVRTRLQPGRPLTEHFAALQSSRRAHFSESEYEAFWGAEAASLQALLTSLQRPAAAATAPPSPAMPLPPHSPPATALLAAVQAAPAPPPLPPMPPPGSPSPAVAASAPLDAAEEERAMREAGATDEEIAAARAENFGVAAAARVVAQQQNEGQWHQRVEAYMEARAAILTGAGGSPVDRAAALDALKRRAFAPHELGRLEAHEMTVADEGSAGAP